MVEPGLFELVRDFYSTFQEPVAAFARIGVPLVAGYALFMSGFTTNLRKNRTNPDQHLRDELNAAQLDDITAEEFYALTESEPGRVNFVNTHRILQSLSTINANMGLVGKVAVQPFYEPAIEAFRQQPYSSAVRAFLQEPECRKRIAFPSLSQRIKDLPSHNLLQPLYWACGGAAAVSMVVTASQISHYAPHNLYDVFAWGSFLGALIGGVGAIAGTKGSGPLVHSLRKAKFMMYAIVGLCGVLISDSAHSNQHFFDNAGPNRAVAAAESKTADAEYLLATWGGKPLCRSTSERELSLCIIRQVGYFKPVDVYHIQPGKEPEYRNLTAKDL